MLDIEISKTIHHKNKKEEKRKTISPKIGKTSNRKKKKNSTNEETLRRCRKWGHQLEVRVEKTSPECRCQSLCLHVLFSYPHTAYTSDVLWLLQFAYFQFISIFVDYFLLESSESSHCSLFIPITVPPTSGSFLISDSYIQYFCILYHCRNSENQPFSHTLRYSNSALR